MSPMVHPVWMIKDIAHLLRTQIWQALLETLLLYNGYFSLNEPYEIGPIIIPIFR